VAVIDFNARVVDPETTEGAAAITVSDGSSGTVRVGLSASTVSLPAPAGGSDARLTLNTGAWHHYRLIVRPNPGPGGGFLAELFLDGNWQTPVMSQVAGPPGIAGVSMGDSDPSASGAWDLDFLRFATVTPAERYLGDLDNDRDVDQSDFAQLQVCLSGDGVPQGDMTCCGASLDGDADVDQADLSAFLGCMSGANATPPGQCLHQQP
jgi:hypothetical protein